MKKELTIKEQKNRYRKFQFLSWIGEFAVVPIPFVTLMIVNRDKWFPNPEVGTRVGIGGGLAIGLMLLATFLVTRDKQSKNKGYISIMLSWALVAVIATLIRDILDELVYIMWFGMIGIGAGFGLDLSRQHFKKKADQKLASINKAKEELDKENAKEQIMEENQKVKVRIK